MQKERFYRLFYLIVLDRHIREENLSKHSSCIPALFPVWWNKDYGKRKTVYDRGNKMRREIYRGCFLILLAGMVLLAGCTGKETRTPGPAQSPLAQPDDRESSEGMQTGQKQKSLRIYLGKISRELSPFFYLTAGDERLLNLLYTKVCASGPAVAASISVKKNSPKRNTIYRITIKENIRDKNGNQMTAEDLLYNYYLRCQLDYRGLDQINQMDIVGLEEYLYGAKGKKLRSRKKKVRERLSYPTKSLAQKIRREIIRPALEREYAWVEAVYLDPSQKKTISGYPKPSMLFAKYFAPDTKYTGKGKSREQVLKDVAGQYGGDIKKLSRVTGEDYTAAARSLAISCLWPKQKTGTGRIRGIRKKNDKTIEIVTRGYRKRDRERLGSLYLLSRHGGFPAESDGNLPTGCGAYVPEEKKGSLQLIPNGYYRQGNPQIERIRIAGEDMLGKGEDISVECANKIAEGDLDMAIVWERIPKEKKNLKKTLEDGEKKWKVAASGGVLYSTERINATTIPSRMTAASDVIQNIGQLRFNG